MNHRDDCGQGSSVKPQISSGTVADFANPLFQAGTFPKFNVHRPKPIARYSALSAAYAAPGWLPAVRFIPTESVSGVQPSTVDLRSPFFNSSERRCPMKSRVSHLILVRNHRCD